MAVTKDRNAENEGLLAYCLAMRIKHRGKISILVTHVPKLRN